MRRILMVIAAFILIAFAQICRAEDCVDYSNSPAVTGRLYLKCPVTFVYCTRASPYIGSVSWDLESANGYKDGNSVTRVELIQQVPHAGAIQCTLTGNNVTHGRVQLIVPEVLNSDDMVTGILICTQQPVGPEFVDCNTWFEKH